MQSTRYTPMTALTAAIAMAALLPGCAQDTSPSAAQPPAPKSAPVLAKPEVVKEEPSTPRTPAVAYTPPYPDRENPFNPPQKNSKVTRRSDGEYDEAVELLGFVTVDQPKAVLSIDGVMASVEAGGQKYGIRVVSIKPPQVVLQRGRNRWTASLD